MITEPQDHGTCRDCGDRPVNEDGLCAACDEKRYGADREESDDR